MQTGSKCRAAMTAWVAPALLVAMTVAMPGGPASAQGDADAAAPVLERHCATCHVVPGYPEPTRRVGREPPTFEEIAADSGTYNRTRLTLILREPHYPMSTFVISPIDINNVIAFIERMRGQ